MVDDGRSRWATRSLEVLPASYLRCLFAGVNGGDHGVPEAHRQIDPEMIL